ncbi:MAG: efflux RND transporter periplasmic adaptor subunit [Desulfovibrio sp.]|jgi:membrane fusion protein (multidrug efflux system)|nr:efflux RND transporter periplasmic adaptor subunit [Desulfovibrio sp.]
MSATDDKPIAAQKAGPRPGSAGAGRSRLLTALAVLFLLAGLGWGAWWQLVLRFEESTDNAYVAGNLVRVSPQVTGNIEAIHVDDNDLVEAGQLLVRLDKTDAELALGRARSSLADAVRQTASLMAESRRLASLAVLRRKELEKARGDYERRRDRRTAMAVSEEELSHARDDMAIAELALKVAEDDLLRNRLLLQDNPLREQPPVRRQAHLVREAWLALKRCDIRSPVRGLVAKRSAQAGLYVTPATPLMAVVPLNEVWVDANFKEVQLERMRPGQKAVVRVDLYGSSVSYAGVVEGFAAGTGSSFSLLPPENATGNWIKVVQRVPVKIVLSQEEIAKSPLLVGLSCTVRVNVGVEPEAREAVRAPSERDEPLFSTDVLAQDLAAIDRDIESIIRANATVDGADAGGGL